MEKRYIIHVAGFNLGILLRALFGFGSPRGGADAGAGLIFARIGHLSLLILIIWLPNVADTPDCVGLIKEEVDVTITTLGWKEEGR